MSARSLAALLLAVASPVGATEAPELPVEELRLANGMKWLLFERHEAPTVAAGWMARVGSANERPGITGLSHFFEHMMFKGTRAIGTTDIDADLELIDEQEIVRAAMREELARMRERLRRGEIDDLGRPESRTERYRELERRFDELVKRQRATIVKDQLDQIYTRNGGEFLNAGTDEDATLYFVRLPRNRLELWCWLESDRLLNPVFREFYSERDVVFEERRLRTEATPLGRFEEEFQALFWQAHPYQWPVVGWASDIPAYTLAQAKEYFATYYAPNNLTGALVGDFRSAAVKPLLERYFGRLPRGKVDPPEVVTLEPRALGEKRYHAEADTSPTVRVWWQGVPFVHKDRAALDLLSGLLSGRTGRLFKGLVLGRRVANQAFAFADFKKHAGIFGVEVTVKDGQGPAAAEEAVYAELERLKNEPVPDEELLKVKNQEKAAAYRRLLQPLSIMQRLLVYDALGDWRYLGTAALETDAVTAADVQRVAREYLAPDARTVGVFRRKGDPGR
ncbi:MAG TPA: pitrilysin family protein [Vicinamibacteria bacterium]|nr:pitrilysin family protein [Vicinamibacteria bacterium]